MSTQEPKGPGAHPADLDLGEVNKIERHKSQEIERMLKEANSAEQDRLNFAVQATVPMGAVVGREDKAMEFVAQQIREVVPEGEQSTVVAYWAIESKRLSVILTWPNVAEHFQGFACEITGVGHVLMLTEEQVKLAMEGKYEVPEEFAGTWERII